MFKEIVDDGRRTTDDGHWAITKAHHEHFVLSGAKNKESVMYEEQVWANKAKDSQSQGHWGMNSASELATVYHYTRRSISGGSQPTPPGDKAWCIMASIEHYSGYRHFQ